MNVFNTSNTAWKGGTYPLFLGQAPALYDSVNVAYPEIFALYKAQKAADWSEDEIDLTQSRIDMLDPDSGKDIMRLNLSLQWELDSVASRSIAPLFAPFVTNSEYWAALLKISEIEVLHALTYSEIVRQCIPDTKELFESIMESKEMTARASPVAAAFMALQKAGAEYTLGLITDDEAYPIVMNAVVALYCLERLQFMASFAATFAVVEQGYFQGIGKLVQKIMQDERFIHAELGRIVIGIELQTERGKRWRKENNDEIAKIVDDVYYAEIEWSKYLFSQGRKIVGLNETILNSWVEENAEEVYDVLSIDTPFQTLPRVGTAIPFMANWLNMDKTQNAQQEADSANYNLNIIVDDLGEDVIEFEI